MPVTLRCRITVKERRKLCSEWVLTNWYISSSYLWALECHVLLFLCTFVFTDIYIICPIWLCVCMFVCMCACAVTYQIPWNPDVDLCWHTLINGVSDDCEPEWCASEDPLFILYTSGSTGKPKVKKAHSPTYRHQYQ